MSDRVPVLVSAFNEAKLVGRALERLDASLVEPIVLANGCIDETVEVAKGYGVTILERDEPGKMPAIQDALRRLAGRALDPLLMLDADSFPKAPNAWPKLMSQKLAVERPFAVSGLLAFCDGGRIADAARSYRRLGEARQAQSDGSLFAFAGANMGIRLETKDVLDRVLDLPHIWPGEDRAIVTAITEDADGGFDYCLDSRAVVVTSARSYPPLAVRVLHGRQAAIDWRHNSHQSRAVQGVTHEFTIEHGLQTIDQDTAHNVG